MPTSPKNLSASHFLKAHSAIIRTLAYLKSTKYNQSNSFPEVERSLLLLAKLIIEDVDLFNEINYKQYMKEIREII